MLFVMEREGNLCNREMYAKLLYITVWNARGFEFYITYRQINVTPPSELCRELKIEKSILGTDDDDGYYECNLTLIGGS